MSAIVRCGLAPLPALLATGLMVVGCAPAPLYTASGGIVSVHGEIPRDARGEPVWHLIRPAAGGPPMLTREQVEQAARMNRVEPVAEGSRPSDPQ